MCATCGCGTDHVHFIKLDGKQLHLDRSKMEMDHDHLSHGLKEKTLVQVERDILHKNNLIAAWLKDYYDAKNIFSINLMSAPGSGKTTLLEKTLVSLKKEIPCFVIEGDQQTTHDAERIRNTGTPVIQVNTAKGCHLDAEMIYNSLKILQPEEHSILFIENVGNLVCPAMFDLGEVTRVVIISATEGDDKPAKYPDMFQSADLCIINKIDLLPYVNFEINKCKQFARKIHPKIKLLELSATSGEGMQEWLEWLKISVHTTA